MTEEPSGIRPPARDPMKGIRGIFAAVLVLETIAVLLALLVVSKFTEGALNGAGLAIVWVLALLMVVACAVQRKPWGLGFALVLQVALIACGFIHASLAVLGVIFGLVWVALLLMRRDVAGKMARGELPSQRE
ncbi:MAG: DUF4233 domain-containing protein [Pseudonocardia sp.]|nr:DUF4233 domain-containing protein [Pseudonocardia sp.]